MQDPILTTSHHMVDGDDFYSTDSPPDLPPHREQILLATRYLKCYHSKNSPHAPRITTAAFMASDRLTAACNWINSLLIDTGHSVRINFFDGSAYNAQATDYFSDGRRGKTSDIFICLGCIPILLGTANVLELMRRDVYASDSYLYGNFGITNKWDPLSDPIGILTFDSVQGFDPLIETMLNALELTFFHEVSHIVLAHNCHPKLRAKPFTAQAPLHRAAEFESDWGAGWLMWNYLMQKKSDSRRPFSPDRILEAAGKIILAAVCTYTAVQIQRKPTEFSIRPYHLPPIRLTGFIRGALFAEAGLANHYSEIEEIFEREIIKYPVELVFGGRVPHWCRLDENMVEKDRYDYLSETLYAIDQISEVTADDRLLQSIISAL